jgi:hypothetical protein
MQVSSLTSEQIANLTRKDDIRMGSHKSRWLSAKDAEQLLKTMDKGKYEVVLGGIPMTVTYEGRDKVFVKPKQHGIFSPCGWYTRPLLNSIAADS